MKLCGLTGGVGMGKSTAAGCFLQAGVRVIDTDVVAREIVQPGQPALTEIKNEFGGGYISSAGELKREALAHLVFGDTAAREKLEAILHPRIRAVWLAQIETWRREKCPLAVVVIPLLFETQAEPQFDKIISVACTPAAQHERLCQRGWTTEQIQQRIAAQLPVGQKIARSHFVIWTEGSLAAHAHQVEWIIAKTTSATA